MYTLKCSDTECGLVLHVCIMTSTGADISNAKLDDAGLILSDVLRDYMQIMGVVNGLKELGFSSEDVPDLVTGTLPQVMFSPVPL